MANLLLQFGDGCSLNSLLVALYGYDFRDGFCCFGVMSLAREFAAIGLGELLLCEGNVFFYGASLWT